MGTSARARALGGSSSTESSRAASRPPIGQPKTAGAGDAGLAPDRRRKNPASQEAGRRSDTVSLGRWSDRTLDVGAVAASHGARGGIAWVALGGLSARARRDPRIFFETAASTWAAAGAARAASHLIGRRRPCADA